jgi:hypothetical protein
LLYRRFNVTRPFMIGADVSKELPHCPFDP